MQGLCTYRIPIQNLKASVIHNYCQTSIMSDTSIRRGPDYAFSSSSLGSSSSRSIFHVGRPAIYIAPKLVSDFAMPQDEPTFTLSVHNNNHNNNHDDKQASLKDGTHEKQPKQYQNTPLSRAVQIHRYDGLGYWIIEGLIMVGFIVCSLEMKQYSALAYLDLAINMFCLIKIVVLHLYIFHHNSTLSSSSPQSISSPVRSPNPNPSVPAYTNSIQMHEILQLWSLATTVFLTILDQQSHPAQYTIVAGVRLPRLLFLAVLAAQRSKSSCNIAAIWASMKVLCMIALITSISVIGLQLLLYNIDNYYCLSTATLAQLTITSGQSPDVSLLSCGINHICQQTQASKDVQCRNIYSLVGSQIHIDNINTVLSQYRTNLIQNGNGFSHGFAVGVAALVARHAGFYQMYRVYIPQWIILPLVLLAWLCFVVMLATGIGQSLRHDHLSSFKSYLTHKQQLPTIQPPTSQFQQVTDQLASRSVFHKLVTVLFNCTYLFQVILIIVGNIHQQTASIRQWTGIGLGVIFIIWAFGFALAVFQHCNSQKKEQSQGNRRNILIFQATAIGLAACDYLLRILYSQYLFESSTAVTPFSQAVISLRVIFILYNNGFDAYVSVYTQKIMEASSLCMRQVGTVAVIGLIIGLSIALVDGNLSDNLQNRVVEVGRNIGMIFGLSVRVYGKEGYEILYDRGARKIIQAILSFVALLCSFYLTKNIIMVYSQILPIDLSSQEEYDQNLIINKDSKLKRNQQQIEQPYPSQSPLAASACPSPSPYSHPTPSTSPPLIISTSTNQSSSLPHKFCCALLDSQYYTKCKILVLIVYTILSLSYQHAEKAVDIIKFIVDILLVLDLIAHLVVQGLCKYFRHFTVIKSAYVVSQIYLCLSFCIVSMAPTSLTSSLHLSRMLLILDSISSFRSQIINLYQIWLHPRTRIYKILLIMLCCGIISLLLITDKSNAKTDTYVGQGSWSLVMCAVGLVFGFGYNAGLSMGLEIIVVDFVYALIVIFLHGLILYLILTHLQHQQIKSQPTFPQSLLSSYSSPNPSIYSHRPSNHPFISSYLKALKICLIAVTLVLLGLLSGEWLQVSPWRPYVAGANLVINFVEIWIYLIEGWVHRGKWGKIEAVVLGVGVPGSAFLVFPVLKFETYLQLSVVIRIFMFFSVLRTFRLFPLLNSHRCSILCSHLIRRITSNLFPVSNRILSLIMLLFSILLPVSLFLTKVTQPNTNVNLFSDPFPEMLNLLSGRSLLMNTPIDNSEFLNALACIVKIFTVSFVVFPIKMVIIAEVIRLININIDGGQGKYTRYALMETIRQHINEAIVWSGLLDRQKQELYVPLQSLYRFTAQISRIFRQISQKNPIKCEPYPNILLQLKSMQTSVYIFSTSNQQDQKQTEYGIFVYDIIYHYFNKFIKEKSLKVDDVDRNVCEQKEGCSLYCLNKLKKENVIRAHFRIDQYYSYLRIKEKFMKKIRKLKKQQKNGDKLVQPMKTNRSVAHK